MTKIPSTFTGDRMTRSPLARRPKLAFWLILLALPALTNAADDNGDQLFDIDQMTTTAKSVGPGPGQVEVEVPHGAHLRATADLEGQVLTAIPQGTIVKVTGRPQGHWIPVEFGKQTGFIHKNLVRGEIMKEITEAGSGCTSGDCAPAKPKHKQKKDAEDLVRAVAPRPAVIKPAAKPPASPKPPAVQSGRGPLPHADIIQRNISAGLSTPAGWCALAVWRILLKAHLVKGDWNHSGADAINMGHVLRANGFVSDQNACTRPGVVRIYDGNRSGHSFARPMSGDRFGHIEIYSLDHQYHSYYSSGRSITQSMQARFGSGLRRPLQSCWYKP